MNWTGGSRARSGKPSTDTARLQKRYFARVRARSTAAPTPTPSRGTPAAQRQARIPELDIVVKSLDPRGVAKKEKKRRTGPPVPFEGLPAGGTDIKAKRRRLLEEESWVCTALAGPLVLKGAGVRVHVGPQGGRATPEVLRNPELPLLGPVVQGGEVPNPRYHPLERGPVGSGDRGPGGGVVCNLSDGGFVQIGGASTRCGESSYGQQRGGSVGRELSDISEEMLLDIGGRQEESSPPTMMPLGRGGPNNIFARQNGAADNRRGAAVSLDDWSLNRHAHMHGGLPSSPLAPYSQGPREWGLSASPVKRLVVASQEGEKDILEEIDEAATGIWTSSPFEAQATPPAGLAPLARDIHAHEDSPGGAGNSTGLGRLLQGGPYQTQNESLVAYASSGGSSAGEDEGAEWMLGSNIPLPGSRESTAEQVPAEGEFEDEWETFLNGRVVGEEGNSMDSHPRSNEEPDVLEGFEDIAVSEADCRGERSQDFIESLGLEYREPSAVPVNVHTPPPPASSGDTGESWRGFAEAPPAEPGPEASGAVIREVSIPVATNPGTEEGLELGKDEDSAWRAFVFAGLSEPEHEHEPERPNRRTATLPLKLKSSMKPPRAAIPPPAPGGENRYPEGLDTVARRASRFFAPGVGTAGVVRGGAGGLYSGGRGRGAGGLGGDIEDW